MDNKFILRIGGSNYSNNLIYPVSIFDKNLNGAHDELSMTLKHVNTDEPIKNYQKVELRVQHGPNGVYLKNFFGYVASDNVRKEGVLSTYSHEVRAIEYVGILGNYISPNITITRNTNPSNQQDYYAPTLFDVYERVIAINRKEHPYLPDFNLSPKTRTILQAIESPEWTFVNETLYSIVNMIFNYALVNPRFEDFTTLGHISPAEKQSAEEVDFTGYERTYDPTTMNIGLVTQAQNIEVEDYVLEPAYNSRAVKSTDGFEISADSLLIETEHPIAHIKDLTITPYLHATAVGKTFFNGVETYRIVRKYIPYSVVPVQYRNNSVSIDKQGVRQNTVVEKSYYDTLTQTWGDNAGQNSIGDKLYFETGKPHIHGLSPVPKYKSRWTTKQHVIEILLERTWEMDVDNSYFPKEAIPSGLIATTVRNPYAPGVSTTEMNNAVLEYLKQGNTLITADDGSLISVNDWTLVATTYFPFEAPILDRGLGGGPELEIAFTVYGKDWTPVPESKIGNVVMENVSKFFLQTQQLVQTEVIVNYAPMIDQTVYTFREQNVGEGVLPTVQNYNQTTNRTSASALGNLLDSVSKSNSGEEKTVKFLHTNANELIEIGSKHKDYVITGALSQIYKDSIYATYSFDQYYRRLNPYIALREEWRAFEVPKENVVSRQITFNTFAKFENEKKESTSGMFTRPEMYVGNSTRKVSILSLAGPINYENTGANGHNTTYILPAVSMSVNNSIIFSAEMRDNQIIGTQSKELYDEKGKLLDDKRRNQSLRLKLPAIVDYEFADSELNFRSKGTVLPWYRDGKHSMRNPFMKIHNYHTDIDLRELVRWSGQLHHIDTTGDITINPGWTAVNGLVGGSGLNDSNLRFVYLNVIPYNRTTIKSSEILDGIDFKLQRDGTSFRLQNMTNATRETAVALAVLKGNEILLHIRETVEPGGWNKTRYLNFSDEYINRSSPRKYHWEELPYDVEIYDFNAMNFNDLPEPTGPYQYARVMTSGYVSSQRHEANQGFIAGRLEDLPITQEMGKRAITTGFDLEEISSSEYEKDSQYEWRRGKINGEPQYVVYRFEDLPEPQWLRTGRVRRTDYKRIPYTSGPVNEILANYDMMPKVNTDTNYKAIITNHDIRKSSWDEWNEGRYLGWISIRESDMIYYSYDVRYRTDLPIRPDKNWEDARVSNFEWNESSETSITPDMNYYAYADQMPVNLTAGGIKATVVNATLSKSTKAHWDNGIKKEWKPGSLDENPNYYVHNKYNLPSASRAGMTARVDNTNWNLINRPSNMNADNFLDLRWDMYNMRPQKVWNGPQIYCVVNHHQASLYDSYRQWEENRISGNDRNIHIYNYSYDTNSQRWYAIYKEEPQYFEEINYTAFMKVVFRIDDYQNNHFVLPIESQEQDKGELPEYYQLSRNPEYFISVEEDIYPRIRLTGPNNNREPYEFEVWSAFEKSYPEYFWNMSAYHDRNLMIEYFNGKDTYYYYTEKNNPNNPQRMVSSVDFEYYKAKEYFEGIRISSKRDLGKDPTDEDVWRIFREDHTQYFDELERFSSAGGIFQLKVDRVSTFHYTFQANNPEYPYVDYQGFAEYINQDYVVERIWNVPRVVLQVSEGGNENDVWWTLQREEPKMFEDLDLFESRSGVIYVDFQTGPGYYKLKQVSFPAYMEYWRTDLVNQTFYISKEIE